MFPARGGKVGNDMYFVDLDLFATMNYRTGVRNCDMCKVYIDESAEWTVDDTSGYHFHSNLIMIVTFRRSVGLSPTSVTLGSRLKTMDDLFWTRGRTSRGKGARRLPSAVTTMSRVPAKSECLRMKQYP